MKRRTPQRNGITDADPPAAAGDRLLRMVESYLVGGEARDWAFAGVEDGRPGGFGSSISIDRPDMLSAMAEAAGAAARSAAPASWRDMEPSEENVTRMKERIDRHLQESERREPGESSAAFVLRRLRERPWRAWLLCAADAAGRPLPAVSCVQNATDSERRALAEMLISVRAQSEGLASDSAAREALLNDPRIPAQPHPPRPRTRTGKVH